MPSTDDRRRRRGKPTELRGRRPECAALNDLIAKVRGGSSRVLVVRGEAGVGKTALLNHVFAATSDLRVVRLAGAESEMELAFAALQQLCTPLLDGLPDLPEPQREGLEVAFGLNAGPPPDRFLVGLAVLGLLSAAADEHPLICVVDDAQWLDQASARTLAFVARRLCAEPVGLVFATREPGEEFQGLPALDVKGLRNGDARALLQSAVRVLLDERIRDLIVAETRGNPLALLELPRRLTAMQLAGGFGLLTPQALSGRIEESFSRDLMELPPDARRLMLVAAAEPTGDPRLVLRAAERLGIRSLIAAAAAEREGLLSVGRRVTFRHPLVRSAVYETSAMDERRLVHLALASVTDPERDPDRRAWHLAAAASAPDEEVASQLERSAGRAQARGGLAAAAAFLERAVELTPEPTRRANRVLAAAQTSLEAGEFDAALRLLAMTETSVLDTFGRARVALVRGQVAFASGVGGDAPSLLLDAARQLEPLDLSLARETYLAAWGAAAFADRGHDRHLLEVSTAVRALPPTPGPPRAADLLLESLSLLITEGRAAAVETLRRASDVFANGEVSREEGLRWGWMATAASNAIWDNEATGMICERQVQFARDAGALERLPIYLVALGTATILNGDFAEAASLVAEVDEVTAATGAQIPPFAALLLLALRGSDAEASALMEATRSRAVDFGQGIAVTQVEWAASILHNGFGRYELALAEAQRATSDPFTLYASMWALPELVEAASRCGQFELARSALVRLTETTNTANADFALGIEARSRALLEDGEAAGQRYLEAIDRLSRTRMRPDLGRAHLLYGEWLSREGRRVEATAQLHTAHDTFTSIGMGAFADRARIELAAIGEKVHKAAVDSRHGLTAQEQRIALLARDGLSNAEIGMRLLISPRTVEWHLHKVFAKLQIDSRRDLVRGLPEPARPNQA